MAGTCPEYSFSFLPVPMPGNPMNAYIVGGNIASQSWVCVWKWPTYYKVTNSQDLVRLVWARPYWMHPHNFFKLFTSSMLCEESQLVPGIKANWKLSKKSFYFTCKLHTHGSRYRYCRSVHCTVWTEKYNKLDSMQPTYVQENGRGLNIDWLKYPAICFFISNSEVLLVVFECEENIFDVWNFFTFYVW